LVFAGDNKWYPQSRVDVKGSIWSVKCQFGNPDSPGGGSYKVAAVLSNELNEEMWYSELPNGIAKSNIIHLHRRHEVTREQELSSALATAQSEARTLDVDLRGKKQQLKEVQRERDRYKSELAAAKEEAGEWQRSYHEVNNRVTPIKNLNENYEDQIKTLQSELKTSQHEAKEGTLRANDQEGQKDGIYKLYRESERQLAKLTWLKQLAEEQAKDISEHVAVILRPPGSLILNKSPRWVTIGLKIRNESVFDITIDPKEVKGRLFFDGTPLHEDASQLTDDTRWPITNLKPKQTEMFVIKQPLLKSESETIAECEKAGTQFWLGNLYIPISVLGDFNVTPQRLRIHGEMENVPLKDFSNTNNA
jgi:hypothetical protein